MGIVLGLLLANSVAAINFIILPASIYWLIRRRIKNISKHRNAEAALAITLFFFILLQLFYGQVGGAIACGGKCGVNTSTVIEPQNNILLTGTPPAMGLQLNKNECDALCAKLLDIGGMKFVDVEIFPGGIEKNKANADIIRTPAYIRFTRIDNQASEYKLYSQGKTVVRARYRYAEGIQQYVSISRMQIAKSTSRYSMYREYNVVKLPFLLKLFLGADLRVYTETLIDREDGTRPAISREVIYRPIWVNSSRLLGPIHIHENVKFTKKIVFDGMNVPMYSSQADLYHFK